jgi:non-ribosomal peptide synthetase component F
MEPLLFLSIRAWKAHPDVGIYVERSLEMVVGTLGILKAGGAYVPLDPSSPKDRLAFMLTDAGVSIVLTQRKLIEQFPAASIEGRQSKNQNLKVVCLDPDWKVVAQESGNNPGRRAQAGNSAYVIYTSGSTGRPKGDLRRYLWHHGNATSSRLLCSSRRSGGE